MNKQKLLHLLAEEAQLKAYECFDKEDNFDIDHALFLVNGGVDADLPDEDEFPYNDEEKLIAFLREYYGDEVSLISLVLSSYFPEKYVFYRPTSLEPEIFEGLKYFSEVFSPFDLDFNRVGPKGFDNYLKLNQALIAFWGQYWPGEKYMQTEIAYFLYRGLTNTFLEKSEYNQYWLMVTREGNWEELDNNQVVQWSGRKEMKQGDLVFMYRTQPWSSVTDLFRVKDAPEGNPWAPWDGLWVNLEKICSLKNTPFTFAQMHNHPDLKEWALVKNNFWQVSTAAVPYAMYNALIERVPKEVRKNHAIEFENIEPLGDSGIYATEAEFEDIFIKPRLESWAVGYEKQFRCNFHYGRQVFNGRVDFLLKRPNGKPFALIETKRRIKPNSRELYDAREQAKSYALALGLPYFIVASPESFRIYSLNRNNDTILKEISVEKIKNGNREVRDFLHQAMEKELA